MKKPSTGSEWEKISQTYTTVTSVSSLSFVFPWDEIRVVPPLTYSVLKEAYKEADKPKKPKAKPKPKFVQPPTGRVIDLGD